MKQVISDILDEVDRIVEQIYGGIVNINPQTIFVFSVQIKKFSVGGDISWMIVTNASLNDKSFRMQTLDAFH